MEIKVLVNTRFDNAHTWNTAARNYVIKDMESAHLINVLRYFMTKPEAILEMLVKDIDNMENWQIFFPGTRYHMDTHADTIKGACNNFISSHTTEELILYAMRSILAKKIRRELYERDFNVERLIDNMAGLGGYYANYISGKHSPRIEAILKLPEPPKVIVINGGKTRF